MAIANARTKKLRLMVAFFSFRSSVVLVVADLFHPIDGLPVDLLLNGDMRHSRGWGSTVPMLLARWEPDDIAGVNLLNRTTLTLDPTAAGCHDQGLPQRMCMPRGACAGLERDARAGCASWSVGLE